MTTATETMSIHVNGDAREVPARITVAELLAHLELHPRMVVVEHNAVILRRETLADTPVMPGDSLELVHFVGGG